MATAIVGRQTMSKQTADPQLTRAVPCPTCKRPRDNPDAYSRTDRVFAISGNPLVSYMRMHDYAGPGSIPELSRKFVAFLDGEKSMTAKQMAIAVEILTEFCQGRRTLASVVIAVAIEGRSYRELSEELHIDDKTVRTIADHGRIILDQLCREAGVYKLSGDA